MKFRALFAALLALAIPLVALATNEWGATDGCTKFAGIAGVTPGSTICFDATETITVPNVSRFSVKGDALACLRPNVAAAGVATMTAKVWYCAPNASATTASCGIEVCAAGGCTLDGANGTPATQTACVNVGSGTYLLEVLTAPAAGTTGLFFVKGE